MPITYHLTFYSTPSHGYLAAPLWMVEETDIRPTKYSFKAGQYWYLEEDVDAPWFLAASQYSIQVDNKFVDEVPVTRATKHLAYRDGDEVKWTDT